MHISIPSGRYSYRTVVIYNTYKGERRLKDQVPLYFSTKKPATAVSGLSEQLVGKETASLLFCRVCSGSSHVAWIRQRQSRVSVTQRQDWPFHSTLLN